MIPGGFTGQVLHQPCQKNAAQMCRQAIATANEMGVTVSCDINYRDNLWNYGKTATEVMSELVAKKVM